MGPLPLHHIPRPRLVDAVSAERVVVVEAGGGYGKTTLATEVVHAWGAIEVGVTLHERDGSAARFVSHLRAGIARAGFPAAALSVAGAGEDLHEAIDAALDALADEPCAFVLDDVHHAEREGAELIDWLARRLRGELRLLVLARRLPPGAERLRRAEICTLTAADLALAPGETLELCRAFDPQAEEHAVLALHAATGGWTAAAVLAAARARRTGEPLAAIALAADAQPGQAAVATILEESLAALTPAELHRLAQVARVLPTDREIVDSVGGEGFLDRLRAAGVPFVAAGEQRWDLPGPVRDLLIARAPADTPILSRVAGCLGGRGELGGAVELLLGLGEAAAAAGLLASAAPAALDVFDLLELSSFIERLDAQTLERHPGVLLHFARVLDDASLWDRRSAVLDQLEDVLHRSEHPEIAVAVAVERTTDRIRVSEFARVEAEVARLLERTELDAVTEARALSALARATCMRTDESGARDEAAIRRSGELFDRAAAIYRRVGLTWASAGTVPYRAMWIDYALGDALGAMELLEQGLAEVVERPRRWAYLQALRAEVLCELSRYEEAEDAARQVDEVGERLSDDLLIAFADWNRALIASHLGDGPAVIKHVRRVERRPGDWFRPMSGDFLGDAADALDRVGEPSLAWEYLERALADPVDGEPLIAMAEAALLARHGDPERAERCLAAVFTHRVDPRERWRVTLFMGYAAFRRGDRRAGALAARAFEEAARIGVPQLPLTKEREVSEALLALAAETGQPAALALQSSALPAALSVLGRFSLTRAGRPVELSAGRGPQLLKLLVTAGGHLPVEVVIDTLWPDADRAAGRNRLRTTLSRLRAEAGDIVVRNGETLSVSTELRVDLHEFERDARRALALGEAEPSLAVAVASSAMARYRGDLLPEDPYEPWLERPRDRAKRIALELLDLSSDIATDRGDLDEVRRVVELAIELAPYDEHRYLRVASALLEQGRRGAALAVLARARSALAELGMLPPLDLVRIERRAVGEAA